MRMRDIRDRGETAACRYLKKNGYTILERNYQKKWGEIDIIARKDSLICFVEVKTRQSIDFGLPCEFVTHSKQQKMIRTAYTYIQEHMIDSMLRFDVVEVLHDGQKIQALRHIPDAFTL